MSNSCNSLRADYGVDYNPLAHISTVDTAQSHAQGILRSFIEIPRVGESNENSDSGAFNHSVNLLKPGGPSSKPVMSSSLSPHYQSPRELRRHSPRIGGLRDYYQVMVRLKPKLKRAPGVYVLYNITPPMPTSGEEKSPAEATSPFRDRPAEGPSHALQSCGDRNIAVVPSSTRISITKPTTSENGGERCTYEFEFNDVMGPNTSDVDMCNGVVPRILEQLDADYNVCVLCYGQIGSGKTHTINALSQALIKAVFDSIASTDVVELSFVQIYGNKAYNLLAKSSEKDLLGMPLPKPRGNVVCEPKYIVKNELDAQIRRKAAQKYRHTSTHALNARSSRSHALFSLHITKYRGGVPLSTSKVTLVDLAGSERVEEIGAAGEGMDEAIAINKSLLLLRSYIVEGDKANDTRSYDASLLMAYLTPRLRNWHVLLIVTASLDKNNFEMTKSSLEFATASKQRVVEKRKYGLEDRFCLSGLYEQAFTDLTKIIATLRGRACVPQEDLCLEWGRHHRREGLTSSQFPESTDQRMEAPQALPRVQEKEQRALSRGDQPHHVDCHGQENQGALSEHDEGLLKDKQGNPVIMKGAFDKLTDLFLWLCVQLDELHEQCEVLEKIVKDMCSENCRLVAEVERSACEINQRDERVVKLVNKQQSITEELDLLKNEIEQLHLESFLGYVDRTVQNEMMEMFKYVTEAKRVDGGDFNRCDPKAVESANTADQAYLSIQRELEASEKKYEKLKEEWEICLARNKLLWSNCTPQQKMCILSSETMDATPYSDSGSSSHLLIGGSDNRCVKDNLSSGDGRVAADCQGDLSFGMESIKLRYIVRDLKATLEETIYERSKASEESHTLALDNERLRQQLQDEVEKNLCHDKEMRQVMQSMRILQQQVESSNAYFAGQKNKYADLAAALDRSDEENKRLSSENDKLKAEIRLLRKQGELPYRLSSEREPFHLYGAFPKHVAPPLSNGLQGVVGPLAPSQPQPPLLPSSSPAEGVARRAVAPGRRRLTHSKGALRRGPTTTATAAIPMPMPMNGARFPAGCGRL